MKRGAYMPEHGFRIIEYDRVESTNTICTELAKKGEAGGLCVAALEQSAGRGRRGRSFCSPAGTGLYFSVLYRGRLGVEDGLLITPAAACAVSRALETASGRKMGIKWVNDIFCGGKKVCGILTESKFDFSRSKLDYAVIGIGINLAEPQGGFPPEISGVAGAVFERGRSIGAAERRSLLESLLCELGFELDRLEQGPQTPNAPAAFLEEYRRRSVLIGKTVAVMGEKESYPAVVVGIDDHARLLVSSEGRINVLSSGEVSVRLK